MKTLREKLKKQGGFTMVEMLIVVAIIAILMAVSIPMFNNALEKARHGVDAANLRNAISLANAEAIASLDPKKEFEKAQVYYYIVDDTQNSTTEHQAKLSKTDTGAVEVQCTEATVSKGLMVAIKYDDAEKEVKIAANWAIGTNGHIVPNANYATLTTP